MTNIKLSVVQKARYAVLVFPVAFLLFSIFAVISMIFAQRDYAPTHDVESPLSAREIFIVATSGYCALWTIVKIMLNVKQGIAISAELKSGLALFLGLTQQVQN